MHREGIRCIDRRSRSGGTRVPLLSEVLPLARGRLMADEHGTERTEETVSERSQRRVALIGVLPGDTTCLPIEGKSLILGRDEECDLRLERSRVSRRHAELYRQGP